MPWPRTQHSDHKFWGSNPGPLDWESDTTTMPPRFLFIVLFFFLSFFFPPFCFSIIFIGGPNIKLLIFVGWGLSFLSVA